MQLTYHTLTVDLVVICLDTKIKVVPDIYIRQVNGVKLADIPLSLLSVCLSVSVRTQFCLQLGGYMHSLSAFYSETENCTAAPLQIQQKYTTSTSIFSFFLNKRV